MHHTLWQCSGSAPPPRQGGHTNIVKADPPAAVKRGPSRSRLFAPPAPPPPLLDSNAVPSGPQPARNRTQGLGIALRLTFSGHNQLLYAETWAAAAVVVVCASTQVCACALFKDAQQTRGGHACVCVWGGVATARRTSPCAHPFRHTRTHTFNMLRAPRSTT